MNGKTLEQTQKEKDLGIIVSNDLTWTANAERCEKAIKIFLTIKQNIANGASWIAKKEYLPELHCPYHFIRCNSLETKYIRIENDRKPSGKSFEVDP